MEKYYDIEEIDIPVAFGLVELMTLFNK